MRTKSRAAGRLIESFILLILALSSWHARAESLTFARGAFTEITDADFAPIRARPEFKALVAKLGE